MHYHSFLDHLLHKIILCWPPYQDPNRFYNWPTNLFCRLWFSVFKLEILNQSFSYPCHMVSHLKTYSNLTRLMTSLVVRMTTSGILALFEGTIFIIQFLINIVCTFKIFPFWWEMTRSHTMSQFPFAALIFLEIKQ